MKWPTIYGGYGRKWHGGISGIGWKTPPTLRNHVAEIFWLMRNGRFDFGWHWPELVFGAGRDWYDGPIWFVQAGVFGFSLACK